MKGSEKFASRSRRCIFVGYPYEKKAWKLYDLDTNEFFESRDIVFHESLFLFKEDMAVTANTQDIRLDGNLGPSLRAMYDKDLFIGPSPGQPSVATNSNFPRSVVRGCDLVLQSMVHNTKDSSGRATGPTTTSSTAQLPDSSSPPLGPDTKLATN